MRFVFYKDGKQSFGLKTLRFFRVMLFDAIRKADTIFTCFACTRKLCGINLERTSLTAFIVIFFYHPINNFTLNSTNKTDDLQSFRTHHMADESIVCAETLSKS